MSLLDKVKNITVFGEFWYFLKKYKRWWIGPIVVLLLVIGFVVIFVEGSALAPFIYTLF